MTEVIGVASATIGVLSEGEKLSIIGIVLMLAIVMGVFAWLMWKEERKCRTTMYEEVKQCRDELKALLKENINYARMRQDKH